MINRCGRPKKCRKINFIPDYDTFSPNKESNNFIELELDEFEAIRLSDYNGLTHEEASNLMEISRPVFTKLLERAHKKIAKAIVEGIKIKIKLCDNKENYEKCLKTTNTLNKCKINTNSNICFHCRKKCTDLNCYKTNYQD